MKNIFIGTGIAATLVLGAGCGSEDDPLDTLPGTLSGGGASSMPGSGSSPTSEPPPTSGEAPTSGTDGEMTGGAETETGGAEPTREVCEKYLDCIAVATPEALPGAQMGFGPNGTCWDGPPESIEQCIAACVAGLDTLRLTNLDVPQCVDCIDAAECAGELVCYEGQCVDGYCGDGIVDDDEVCDDPNDYYCEGCEFHQYLQCNPFSGKGCDPGEECIYGYNNGGTPCVQGDLPGLGDGATCDPWNGDYCGPGLTCADASLIAGCPGDGCCTLVCNTQEPDECPNGRECVPDIFYIGVCALL